MPSFDFLCIPCGTMETRYNIRLERADKQKCLQCRAIMTRRPSAPNVKIEGGTPRHYGGK